MNIAVAAAFNTLDWSGLQEEEHAGSSGSAFWKVLNIDGARIRLVRYTANYLADHWCRRGHILYVISGELHTELEDGTRHVLPAGTGYTVGENGPAHRSSTDAETMLFIVD